MQSIRRRYFQARQTLYDEDQYVKRSHRSTFLWSLLGALAVLVVWFTIPYVVHISDPVQFVLPSEEDLKQPTARHVSHVDMQMLHWRDKIGYALDTMQKACDKYHFVSLTNHNVEFDGERLHDSLVYICSMKQGFLNMKIREMSTRDVRCNERYASIHMPVVRSSSIEIQAVDASTFEPVQFSITDAKSSCVFQQAHAIMMSTWSI